MLSTSENKVQQFPYLLIAIAILVLLLVIIAIIVLAALVYLPQWSMLIAAGLAVLWILVAAGQMLTAASYRYFLTSKHVVIDQGFIARKRTTIPLASLDDVQLRQDFFQKMIDPFMFLQQDHKRHHFHGE